MSQKVIFLKKKQINRKNKENHNITYLVITCPNFESDIKELFEDLDVKYDIFLIDISTEINENNIYQSTYSIPSEPPKVTRRIDKQVEVSHSPAEVLNLIFAYENYSLFIPGCISSTKKDSADKKIFKTSCKTGDGIKDLGNALIESHSSIDKNENVKSRRKERFARRVRKMIENRILDENRDKIDSEIKEIISKENEQ